MKDGETGISDEIAFRMRVIEALTKIETLGLSTDQHLARLNGTVVRHEERLDTLKDVLSNHKTQCPLLLEVAALKSAALIRATETQAASAWWQRISPLIWLAIGGVIVLFLVHADELLRAFAKP